MKPALPIGSPLLRPLRGRVDLRNHRKIPVIDARLTADMRRLQEHSISKSNAVTAEMVAAWSMPRRLWSNTLAMLGPLL